MPSSHEEALFTLALAKPAVERAAFLNRECVGDAALLQRLAFTRDGNKLIGLNNAGHLHIWRAPSWAEIRRTE